MKSEATLRALIYLVGKEREDMNQLFILEGLHKELHEVKEENDKNYKEEG